jgi:hypothetical protein
MRIGDKDPEDVWDDGDPVEARLAILERVVGELAARADPVDRHEARRLDALRLVDKLIAVNVPRGRLDHIRYALERLT